MPKMSNSERSPGELNGPLRAIRLNCYNCMCDHVRLVEDCQIYDCQFWPYRLGSAKRAKVLVKAEGKKGGWLTKEEEQAAQVVNKKVMSDEQKARMAAGRKRKGEGS